MTSLTALWNRVLQILGRLSMYRLTLLALAGLAVVAFVLSFFGLVVPAPLELVVTLAVLAGAGVGVDTVAQRILHLPHRYESSIITAHILLFVLRPTIDPVGLIGVVIAAVAASASKYLIAWRGRHIFNPAAVGATVVALLNVVWWDLTFPSWWVGTPAMTVPVLLAGLAVLWRTERLRVIAVFVVIAAFTGIVRSSVQLQAAGAPVDTWSLALSVIVQSPILFLGAFMLSEPLTQPPRRRQQFLVAVVVGVLVGWPIPLGMISLGQERALLIGNLIAFAFAVRTAVRVTLERRSDATPTVRRLSFRASRPVRFVPGQYLELDVPHRRPDARGTRREFSIVSAPEDLPLIEIAFRAPRDGAGSAKQSSFKRALAQVGEGDRLAVTGVWGDFVLPRRPGAPVLMVAAGIGVTPFVSQLRHARLAGEERDAVLVYVASDASELAFRDELEASGVPAIVFTRDRPSDLPAHWAWAQGVRLDADGLGRVVPDIAARHAYISGPPGLIAELAPALGRARSVTTDAFSGY